MSLVIAFCGKDRSFMAGDRREICFRGDDLCTRTLEDELYSGRIKSKEALHERARELGIELWIHDDRCKAWEEEGILIGQVSERDGLSARSRKLHVSCGHFVITEVLDGRKKEVARGCASRFIVLGNRTTQDIAHRCIRSHWKETGGTPADALRIIILAMEEAASLTPSVSATYTLVQTMAKTWLPPIG
ncbi:MAG: DUF2121 domain-containing protein [Methanolinea sp.]|nr:DUF2121 domain-containing protein [Methanolinea sp.]